MTQLPDHLQPQPSGSTRVLGKRPFYKKKRYWVPALLLALVLAVPTDDADQDEVTTDQPRVTASVTPSASPTIDQSAAQAAAAKAAADKATAEEAAADKAAADAAAAAEAQRVAAAEAARVEAERVAAANAAAAEAARVEAERQAAARAAEEQAEEQVEAPARVYYENCDAVRAAGAAPIRVGEPGYADHLDRDGDGQGCGQD